ncbi:hypothetical protein Vadar_002235 [Vaccinium darrowii]|uniref:Uncharacterized protein n=1 Tax=Vaccinium darrowii TaxID=229202 RepID=A0ACB7XMM6_9ERIC|nr:hypothetical protein Vadar_002235 [Vaccinium darrowii]
MELKVFFSLAVVLVSIVVLKLIRVPRRAKSDGQPRSLDQAPGPWKLPLIGSIHHFAVPYLLGTPLHHPLRDLASTHGAFLHLQLGENSTIVISSPELAKEVLLGAFANRHESLAAEIITYKYANLTFCPSGKYHTEMRKKCKEELLNLKKVKSFGSIRTDEVSRLIDSIRSSTNSLIDLSEKISLMTMAIISRAAVGERCKCYKFKNKERVN